MTKHTLKTCGLYTARILKYEWPFFNIMKEKINGDDGVRKNHFSKI